MNAKDAICQSIELSFTVVTMSIGDLSDAELLVRPVPQANHVAWQLGHMIAGTAHMLGELGRTPPVIPESIAKAADAKAATSDNPADFATKADYVQAFRLAKAAALEAVAATPEDALDQPGPESMRDYAPTVASVLALLGLHWLMHSGQITVVRRKLGKPILF